MAAIGNEKIGRLDVAMNDAFGVSRIQRIGDFDAQVNQAVSFERTAQYRFPQSLAFEVLHHDEARPLMFADFVNGADVGMIQGGRGAGFAAKTFEGLRVMRDIVGQKLEGDEAAERVSSAL